MSEEVDTKQADEVGRLSEEIATLKHVIMVQGKMIDDVATVGRKLRLSGNPGVSAAGAQVLGMLVTD